jgi:hypothetical protein
VQLNTNPVQLNTGTVQLNTNPVQLNTGRSSVHQTAPAAESMALLGYAFLGLVTPAPMAVRPS